MFDIRQNVFADGELDEDKSAAYVDGLMEAFSASPEARPLLDSGAGVGYVENMMDFAFGYLGVNVATMTLRDFNEILFDLFPRKMSMEPGRAAAVVEELRAFWQFVHREYRSSSAEKIAASLDPHATDRLEKKLSDPANWGMAKSMLMMGQKAGFDMTTQAGLDAFMLHYNSQLPINNPAPPPPLGGPASLFSSLPPMGMSSKEREKRRKGKKRERQNKKRKPK
jgi:hypothetical protein